MTPQLKNLLIILGAIAIVLILVILMFSGNSRFRKLMSAFLEDGPSQNRQPVRAHSGAAQRSVLQQPEEEEFQKSTSEPIVVLATLIRKSDDRLRIIESTGQERIVDPYYELIFVTRKGRKLKIECSAQAYDRIPFNQQGSLTYKRNTLVKFKFYGDMIYN